MTKTSQKNQKSIAKNDTVVYTLKRNKRGVKNMTENGCRCRERERERATL